ncbi:hypothetical protein Pfo_028006 [Paulownia fortunei]|nr:hypothetical protein Pfo_028006 [Paulownia fortunei]
MKLSEDMFTCAECTSLCEHASLVCRLLNDLKTFKEEREERALNSVNVQTVQGGISEEEAILKVQKLVEYHRRKVLQMVYQGKGSITCKIAHCLYSHDGGDEFSSPQEIAKDMNAVIWEPLELPPLSR